MAEEKKQPKQPKVKKEEQTKEQIATFYQRFMKSQDEVRKKHDLWETLDTFDRGEQWKGTSTPPWIPKPVTNYIRYVRTLKRANLASAIPSPSFYAMEREDEDHVKRLQKAHDHVWDTEKVPRMIRRNIDRALLQGTSIAYVYNDDLEIAGKYYGEKNTKNRLYRGRIKVKRFPNTNFFPDPDAYRVEECKWIDTTELLPLSQIKENPAFREYCEEQGTLKKLENLDTDQLDRTDESSGEIFERDTKVTEGSPQIQGDEMATLHIHWERYFKNGDWHLDVSYYLKNTDFFLLQLKDIQPNEYPFAILYDEEEEQEFWGSSTCMDIIENQKIINKLQQTASILGVLHQNPQKVVFRDSGINAQELARTGTLPGKVWSSNVPGDQAISTIKPMDIPRGLFELDDRTQNNITNMVGVNEAYTGQSVGSLTTSTGVESLIERATIRDKDKMIQVDEFVERISNLIVLHILHKWKDERPITTISANGKPQYETWQPMDKLTAQNLQWRVKSDVYAKAPVTQAVKKQQADKLMQMQGQFQFNPPLIIPEEWLKLQDFEDRENIMERMEADRERMEAEKAQNVAQEMFQIAQQIQEARSQGFSEQEIQQVALQFAQQLVDQRQKEEMKNGISSDNPQKDSQMPQGTTSQVAMSNMANGS